MPAPTPGIVPHLIISGGIKAIDFYQKAFGAIEVERAVNDDGLRLDHAELTIGASRIFLADDFPEMCGSKSRTPKALGGTPCVLHQYVPDCDAAIAKAAAAGATVVMPAEDMFWGDRYGQVEDEFGHVWSFGTPLKAS